MQPQCYTAVEFEAFSFQNRATRRKSQTCITSGDSAKFNKQRCTQFYDSMTNRSITAKMKIFHQCDIHVYVNASGCDYAYGTVTKFACAVLERWLMIRGGFDYLTELHINLFTVELCYGVMKTWQFTVTLIE